MRKRIAILRPTYHPQLIHTVTIKGKDKYTLQWNTYYKELYNVLYYYARHHIWMSTNKTFLFVCYPFFN